MTLKGLTNIVSLCGSHVSKHLAFDLLAGLDGCLVNVQYRLGESGGETESEIEQNCEGSDQSL